MKVYLDTEFTSLEPGNKLISIALVDENGESFYAELNDTYKVRECSDFVKKYVLPILKGGEFVMSENECALKMADWIESRNEDCIIACDNYSWDIPFLNKLLEKTKLWPANLDRNERYMFMIADEDLARIVQEHNFHPHNALDDAKVMQIADSEGNAWEY